MLVQPQIPRMAAHQRAKAALKQWQSNDLCFQTMTDIELERIRRSIPTQQRRQDNEFEKKQYQDCLNTIDSEIKWRKQRRQKNNLKQSSNSSASYKLTISQQIRSWQWWHFLDRKGNFKQSPHSKGNGIVGFSSSSQLPDSQKQAVSQSTSSHFLKKVMNFFGKDKKKQN